MIGAIVFDDAVKKPLAVLATSTSTHPTLDGYDILVKSTKQSFGDSAEPMKLAYFRFYFPKQLVTRYQDKDITGQQLLDGSVILLNDDRVDLKLQ